MTATEILRKDLHKYIDLSDDEILHKVQKAIWKIEQEEDEEAGDVDWDDLPEELQLSIEQGIKDGEEGKGISHEEVMKKYPQWFTK